MDDTTQIRKRAGWTLLVCAVLATVLMGHHPIGSGQGILTPLVHGGLQAILLVELAMFVVVARWLGGLGAMTGGVFLWGGVIAGVLAATINGFVVPALGGYGENDIGGDVAALAWEANQALARLGVIATGLGYGLWSARLWQRGAKVVAGLGAILGLLPALLLIGGHINMAYHGAVFAYVGQSLWLAVLGWYLTRQSETA